MSAGTTNGRRRSTPATLGNGDASTPLLSFSVSVGPERAMPREMLERLNAFARKTGRTRSDVVVAAVARYLAEAERKR